MKARIKATGVKLMWTTICEECFDKVLKKLLKF